MLLRTFRVSFALTIIGLGLAFWYGRTEALLVAVILSVLEISVSFDNAVVNAAVLERMNTKWQRLFLTVGVIIAVFGMRLIFPVLIVCLTAKISPAQAYHLARRGGDVHDAGSYAHLLHEAHSAIAAFGGMFLLMLFLDFVLTEHSVAWLAPIERPLIRLGKVKQIGVATALAALAAAATWLAPHDKYGSVLFAGALGIIAYVLVNGLGALFSSPSHRTDTTAKPVPVGGREAFFLFVYLTVLDSTFSFDGVIGAFAITSDPVIIAIGLGIGAMYIRSLTVYLVRREHSANTCIWSTERCGRSAPLHASCFSRCGTRFPRW